METAQVEKHEGNDWGEVYSGDSGRIHRAWKGQRGKEGKLLLFKLRIPKSARKL